jgi:hypothetical protein
MAFASAVLMFAGSPQTFLGVASAQQSLFLFLISCQFTAGMLAVNLGKRWLEFRVA